VLRQHTAAFNGELAGLLWKDTVNGQFVEDIACVSSGNADLAGGIEPMKKALALVTLAATASLSGAI